MDRLLLRQRAKQVVRRTVGEPYVDKRLKLRRLNGVMGALALTPDRILDAGAEDATFVYWLADRYPTARVLAVDIDEAAISACKAARPDGYGTRVDFQVGYFADLEAASFDLITAFDVLEHIPDDVAAVRDLYTALKKGGVLLVHVPRDRWKTRAGVIHALPDEDAWQINPGRVRQGYSPESMRNLLQGAGFRVQDVQTWLGKWGTLAHEVYDKLENPTPLRVFSIPVTDACAWLDARFGTPDGNTVYAYAVKP